MKNRIVDLARGWVRNVCRFVRRVTCLTAILLVLLPSPAEAQDQRQWINPDLSFYADLPIEVNIGVKIDQITQFDQRARELRGGR